MRRSWRLAMRNALYSRRKRQAGVSWTPTRAPYRGVFKTEDGIIRWQCEHEHLTRLAACECADAHRTSWQWERWEAGMRAPRAKFTGSPEGFKHRRSPPLVEDASAIPDHIRHLPPSVRNFRIGQS